MFSRQNHTRLGVFRKADLRSRNRPPFVASMIVITLTMFVGFAMAVAAWTPVPEVVRAPGETMPTGDFRQVEAPDLGTVLSVAAREGDWVAEGQVLATIASTELSQQMVSLTAELDALRERQRNHAFILQALNRSALDRVQPADEAEELSYAISTLNAFNARRSSDQESIERLAEEVQRHRTALSRLQKRVVDKASEVEDAMSLFEKGLSTRSNLTAREDALSELEDQIHALEINLFSTEKEMAELRAKQNRERLELREKHVEKKFEAEQQISLNVTEQSTLKKRMAALKITAPTDGRIHSVAFPNQGEVIERGETLFELLPTGEALVAVLRLPTRDIGHISAGMTVKMRLETFDARSTEPLNGQIRSISPNRVFDRDLGEDYFRATVDLDQENASFKALKHRLGAGMALTAEIVTRERSMLAYILKPIERSVSSAFGER
ncbi:MAG: HlyD family type I secretion periplasmic adaptor subunit [Pseudomonadota bacterium]